MLVQDVSLKKPAKSTIENRDSSVLSRDENYKSSNDKIDKIDKLKKLL